MVLVDSCRSGSFVSLLTPPSGKERAVATSAESDQEAMFASSGTLSFSYLFCAHIFNGDSFYESYVYGKNGIAVPTRTGRMHRLTRTVTELPTRKKTKH